MRAFHAGSDGGERCCDGRSPVEPGAMHFGPANGVEHAIICKMGHHAADIVPVEGIEAIGKVLPVSVLVMAVSGSEKEQRIACSAISAKETGRGVMSEPLAEQVVAMPALRPVRQGLIGPDATLI
jgi:hypothetical protein